MLIFGVHVAFDNNQLLSHIIKVKVEYQGYIAQKMAGGGGGLVFHKCIFFFHIVF